MAPWPNVARTRRRAGDRARARGKACAQAVAQASDRTACNTGARRRRQVSAAAFGMTASDLPVRLRSLVRRSTPVVAHRSGLSRAIGHRYRGRGVIFMLHSIVDDSMFYPQAML